MELTVTQPVFLWLFGIFAVLGIIVLIALVVIFVQIARLLQLANDKATEVGDMIDEVRVTIHDATQTVNDTRDHIANFVTLTTSAAGIATLVSSIRDSWGGQRHGTDLFDDEPPKKPKSK